MGSLKKYNNSNLASSNMVNARRDEVERLERQRLEVNRKLEHLMRKYSMLTGDRKNMIRKKRIGNAPNDWKPSINASGVERPTMKAWEKGAIIAAGILAIGVIIGALAWAYGDEVVKFVTDLLGKILVPV